MRKDRGAGWIELAVGLVLLGALAAVNYEAQASRVQRVQSDQDDVVRSLQRAPQPDDPLACSADPSSVACASQPLGDVESEGIRAELLWLRTTGSDGSIDEIAPHASPVVSSLASYIKHTSGSDDDASVGYALKPNVEADMAPTQTGYLLLRAETSPGYHNGWRSTGAFTNLADATRGDADRALVTTAAQCDQLGQGEFLWIGAPNRLDWAGTLVDESEPHCAALTSIENYPPGWRPVGVPRGSDRRLPYRVCLLPSLYLHPQLRDDFDVGAGFISGGPLMVLAAVPLSGPKRSAPDSETLWCHFSDNECDSDLSWPTYWCAGALYYNALGDDANLVPPSRSIDAGAVTDGNGLRYLFPLPAVDTCDVMPQCQAPQVTTTTVVAPEVVEQPGCVDVPSKPVLREVTPNAFSMRRTFTWTQPSWGGTECAAGTWEVTTETRALQFGADADVNVRRKENVIVGTQHVHEASTGRHAFTVEQDQEHPIIGWFKVRARNVNGRGPGAAAATSVVCPATSATAFTTLERPDTHLDEPWLRAYRAACDVQSTGDCDLDQPAPLTLTDITGNPYSRTRTYRIEQAMFDDPDCEIDTFDGLLWDIHAQAVALRHVDDDDKPLRYPGGDPDWLFIQVEDTELEGTSVVERYTVEAFRSAEFTVEFPRHDTLPSVGVVQVFSSSREVNEQAGAYAFTTVACPTSSNEVASDVRYDDLLDADRYYSELLNLPVGETLDESTVLLVRRVYDDPYNRNYELDVRNELRDAVRTQAWVDAYNAQCPSAG